MRRRNSSESIPLSDIFSNDKMTCIVIFAVVTYM